MSASGEDGDSPADEHSESPSPSSAACTQPPTESPSREAPTNSAVPKFGAFFSTPAGTPGTPGTPLPVREKLELEDLPMSDQILEMIQSNKIDAFRARTQVPSVYLTVLTKTGWSRTPLQFAAEINRPEIMKILIDRGADVDAVLKDETALTLACSRNNFACAKLLLEHKANVNLSGTAPPLWHAALSGSVELVELLLEHGAQVNATCVRGTPLQAACLRADPEVIRRLLIAGGESDRNIPTAALLLPWRNVSLLRKLLERGIRATVDLARRPLELMQGVVQLARDPNCYLHMMGVDALDTFLPYLIASYIEQKGPNERSTPAANEDRRKGGGDKRGHADFRDAQPQAALVVDNTADQTTTAPAATPAATSLVPSEDIVIACIGMGFQREEAAAAATATNNQGVEAALGWLLDRASQTPAVPKASAQVPPSVAKITATKDLISLGFNLNDIQAAIAAVGDDVTAAVHWIVEHKTTPLELPLSQPKSSAAAVTPETPEFKFTLGPVADLSAQLGAFSFAPLPAHATSPQRSPFAPPPASVQSPVSPSNTLLPTDDELAGRESHGSGRSPQKNSSKPRRSKH